MTQNETKVLLHLPDFVIHLIIQFTMSIFYFLDPHNGSFLLIPDRTG